MEKRSEHRYPYENCVFFAAYNRVYEGKLLNFSRSGLLIESEALLAVGELITIAVPFANIDNHKRKAEVIWSNQAAIGVRFINVR